MITTLFKKIFGSRNDRLVKQYMQQVQRINALEPEMQTLSDEQLRAKTEEFKQRYQQGETLEKLLPEAFAVVREGSRRVLNMRHFDVQLIGGMVLNANKIAEMRTGEGKTLVATLPASRTTAKAWGSSSSSRAFSRAAIAVALPPAAAALASFWRNSLVSPRNSSSERGVTSSSSKLMSETRGW